MKKQLFFITLILFSICAFSQQQFSGRVYYTFSMEPFSGKLIDSVTKNAGGNSKKMTKMARDIFKNMKDVTAILEFANGESLYYVKEEMKVEGKSKLNFTRTFAGGGSKYYLNHHKKDYFYQTSTFGEDMLIEMKPKEWKITQETKTIGGYVCYKAIDIASTNKKQKPIAWFTPQIPINSGPEKNFGLPGLILKVEKYRMSFTAVKIELNPKEKIKIKKPTKGKRMSHKEFTNFLERISPFGKRKN